MKLPDGKKRKKDEWSVCDPCGLVEAAQHGAARSPGVVFLAQRAAADLRLHAAVVSGSWILVSVLARRRYGFLRGLQCVPAQHAAPAGILRPSRLSVDLAVELLAARAAQHRARARRYILRGAAAE